MKAFVIDAFTDRPLRGNPAAVCLVDATLAAARAVHAVDGLDEVHFTNVQGLDLVARISADRISMVFPDYDVEAATAPRALLAALGIEVLRNAADPPCSSSCIWPRSCSRC